MVAHALPPSERDFRGPGCGDDCIVVRAIVPGRFGRTELLLHDPEAHEEYGRVTSFGGRSAVVWTGALVVDLAARSATVYGRELQMTPGEWGFLEHLALHAGRVCSLDELLISARGAEWAGADHLARVTMIRVRFKLGACADLIQTVLGRGYRLALTDPIETYPGMAEPAPEKPWSKTYPHCQRCGRTDRLHEGRGLCRRCRSALLEDRRRARRSPSHAPRRTS